jgi:hypothetical protein
MMCNESVIWPLMAVLKLILKAPLDGGDQDSKRGS